MAEIRDSAVRARADLQRAEDVMRDYQTTSGPEFDVYKLRNLITARDLAAARLDAILDDDRRDAADVEHRRSKPISGQVSHVTHLRS